MRYVTILPGPVRTTINALVEDGFYKQKGNHRSFVGPNGARLTLYDGSWIRRKFSPWGFGSEHLSRTKVVITNTPDGDMVAKDLQFSILPIIKQCGIETAPFESEGSPSRRVSA